MTQVQVVQWKLVTAGARTRDELHNRLLEQHRTWIGQLLQDRPAWPVHAVLEMLLLVQGDTDQIDAQLALWRAQTNGLEPGGYRDYNRFLSVLHAHHQDQLRQQQVAPLAPHLRVGRVRP